MTDENQQKNDAHSPLHISDEVRNAPSLSIPETGAGEVLPSSQLTFEPHHSEFASFQEDYVRQYIALADTKAAWAFAIVSAMFVFFIGTDDIKEKMLNPEMSAGFFSLIGAIVLLLISAFYSFTVIAPRLTSKSGEGFVFFGAVSKRPDSAAYIKDIAEQDASHLTEARLKHCYDVSTICTQKYAALKKSIWYGLPALALSLLASILIN